MQCSRKIYVQNDPFNVFVGIRNGVRRVCIIIATHTGIFYFFWTFGTDDDRRIRFRTRSERGGCRYSGPTDQEGFVEVPLGNIAPDRVGLGLD